MPEDENVAAAKPCHEILWNTLQELDDAVAEMQTLYDNLTGQDAPSTEPDEAEQPPTFSRVLGEAAARVNEARCNVTELRNKFEKLCVRGSLT